MLSLQEPEHQFNRLLFHQMETSALTVTCFRNKSTPEIHHRKLITEGNVIFIVALQNLLQTNNPCSQSSCTRSGRELDELEDVDVAARNIQSLVR